MGVKVINTGNVSRFEGKSHATPDEIRTLKKTRVEIVRLEGFTIVRYTYEPGWRWADCIKPVVKTDSCQLPHIGYAVSGRMTVRLNNGVEKSISAGDSFSIPAGHEGWVDGNEPFVGIEILSGERYLKTPAS